MKEIKMPVYYCERGLFDFEEMANELENRISETLNQNVLITISETEEADE